MPIGAEADFGAATDLNILKYLLEDGSWIVVRTSSTELKIKIYCSIIGSNKDNTEKQLGNIQMTIKNRLGL